MMGCESDKNTLNVSWDILITPPPNVVLNIRTKRQACRPSVKILPKAHRTQGFSMLTKVIAFMSFSLRISTKLRWWRSTRKSFVGCLFFAAEDDHSRCPGARPWGGGRQIRFRRHLVQGAPSRRDKRWKALRRTNKKIDWYVALQIQRYYQNQSEHIQFLRHLVNTALPGGGW